MSTQRWLAFAAALVVLFLASVAAGAFVARMGSTSGQPVANASPTPAPPVSPAVSATPATTPTIPPTAQPTPSPSPAPPSATPTAPPASQPPTNAAVQFAIDLAEAIRGGDDDFLVAHIHPATIDRYGMRACRRYVRQVVSGDDIDWDVHGASGPAEWDYVTDGVTTTISDAWTISVTQAGATPPERELHLAPADGTWRWFTDCGNPR